MYQLLGSVIVGVILLGWDTTNDHSVPGAVAITDSVSTEHQHEGLFFFGDDSVAARGDTPASNKNMKEREPSGDSADEPMREPDVDAANSPEEASDYSCEQTIRPGQDEARLMAVSDEWAVWATIELIEETRYHRVQSFQYCYYRQRLSEQRATLYYSEVGQRIGEIDVTGTGTPFSRDGTIILVRGRSVIWFHADGEISHSEERTRNRIRRIYTDGILLQDSSVLVAGNYEPAPAVFVPFDGTELDFERQVEIMPSGVKSFSGREPIRHGNVWAWHHLERLNIFDGETGEVSQFPSGISDTYGPATVKAFDGETVVVGDHFYDAHTGSRLDDPDDPDRGFRHHSRSFRSGLFAVRNQIGYVLNDNTSTGSWIEAYDFTSPGWPSVRVTDVALDPIGQSEAGLNVWTGEEWEFIPWLTRPLEE